MKPAGRLQFDHLHFVLQAAVDGLGVALAPTSLVAHDLASGRLQTALPAMRMALGRYYCHRCHRHGNQLDLWAAATRLPLHRAAIDLCRRLGREVPWIQRW